MFYSFCFPGFCLLGWNYFLLFTAYYLKILKKNLRKSVFTPACIQFRIPRRMSVYCRSGYSLVVVIGGN